MPSGRRQFVVLFKDCLSRVVDLDLLSSGGDVQRLLVQLVALLAAFSFVASIILLPRYGLSTLPRQILLVNAWYDEEFLIATTMAVAGVFTVLAWDVVFPSRRDCFVLGLLPIRPQVILMAKVASMSVGLGLCILALNVFTGVGYPFMLASRSFEAYWVTMTAAGWFTWCSLLAGQSLLAHLMSHRDFVRASAIFQLTAFWMIVAVYFIKPRIANPTSLSAPGNQRWLALFPSYWFLGLFQVLNHPGHPAFVWLARRALWATATLLALMAYVPAYYRVLSRMVEESDISASDRVGRASHLVTRTLVHVLSRPLDRAILLFTARTMKRSRQHRLLLALFGGVGLAIALAYASVVFHGPPPSEHASEPLLAVSVTILLFSVIGTRAILSFPFSLGSNWIFQVTAVHPPLSYLEGLRKTLLLLNAIPMCTIAVAYICLWPRVWVLKHIIVLLLVGLISLQHSLYRFRKIPFAYQPGSAKVNVRFGAYVFLFLFLTDIGTRLEYFSFSHLAWYLAFILALTTLALITHHRAAKVASPDNHIEFDEMPQQDIVALNLQAK